MKLTEKKLHELIPEIPGTSFDFKGNYTDLHGATIAVTVFDTSYFITNLIQLCANRRVMVDEDNAVNYFISLFQSWRESRKELYFAQAYAYTLKYNPIENYSSVENMSNDITTHEHGYNRTRSYTDYTEKDEYHNSDTTTDTDTIITSPSDTSTESKMAFNSSAFADDTKTTKGGNIIEQHNPTEEGEDPGNIKTDHTGYVDHTTTGSYKDQDAGTDTDRHQYTLTKSGNIGIQTASEMLQKSYDGLRQDLAFRAFSEFIDRYTYYIEGWW